MYLIIVNIKEINIARSHFIKFIGKGILLFSEYHQTGFQTTWKLEGQPIYARFE